MKGTIGFSGKERCEQRFCRGRNKVIRGETHQYKVENWIPKMEYKDA